MIDNIRMRRISEQIKKTLSEIIVTEINDPRVHDVVITKVKVTNDLSVAWIYFTSFDKGSLLEIEIGLNKSKNFIRKNLMKKIHLKKFPILNFERDDTQDNADRLDDLLKQIDMGK